MPADLTARTAGSPPRACLRDRNTTTHALSPALLTGDSPMRKLSVCLALSLVLLTGCDPPEMVPTASSQHQAPHIDLSDDAAPAQRA